MAPCMFKARLSLLAILFVRPSCTDILHQPVTLELSALHHNYHILRGALTSMKWQYRRP